MIPNSIKKFISKFSLIPLFFIFVLLGFSLTRFGMDTWDSYSHLDQSRWLIGSYFGWNVKEIDHLRWYGPLWELILGFLSEILFAFLRDPTWVKYSFTFALYPTTVFLIFKFLVKNNFGRSTAILACATFLGDIRLAGHSVINTKDFPFACAYLLCSLYLWSYIQKFLQGHAKTKDIIAGTVISLIPYLLRTPVAFHFLIWIGFIWFYFLVLNSKPIRHLQKLFNLIIPFITATVVLESLWPSLWHHSSEWVGSFSMMSKFFWQGKVRAFGQEWQQNHVPIWYPLSWIIVIFQPFAFLSLVTGMLLQIQNNFFHWKGAFQKFKFNSEWIAQFMTLENWLFLTILLSWSGFFFLHPIVYDEDRHLLFLYPPLSILAALGLKNIEDDIKSSFSAVIILASILSFIKWGKFSYVYKSPLVPNRHADQFMGDYWGVCISEGVRALPTFVPKGSIVVIPGPYNAAVLQYMRLNNSTLNSVPNFGPYRFSPFPPQKEPYYVLSYNRLSEIKGGMPGETHLEIDIQEGRAIKLWEDLMPPGDPACSLGYFPNRVSN